MAWHRQLKAVGGGIHPESYQSTLSNCLVKIVREEFFLLQEEEEEEEESFQKFFFMR